MKNIFLLIFLVIVLLADHNGYFNAVISSLYLDKVAIQLGETKLTLYLAIKSIVYCLLLVGLCRVITNFFANRIDSIQKLNKSSRFLIVKTFNVFAYITIGLIFLHVLGINITAFAFLGGAIGIGLGFGLQKISANFISGFILLLERSIEEDDLIELENGIYGFIRKISARYTLIETVNGKEVMIPNEEFISTRVTNWTFSHNKARVDIAVGVSYSSDLKIARKIMLECAHKHSSCSKKSQPECYVTEFADSSINLLLYFWVDDILKGRLAPKSDVMISILEEFQKSDINIPFPQRDVHISQL